LGGAVARNENRQCTTYMKSLTTKPTAPVVISPAITNGAEKPLTSAQLAEHLQVTTRTLATYRAQRRIPFWRINSRTVRYRLSDVERALAK